MLLLGLAGMLDIFEEVRDPFGLRAQSCELLYGFVPQKYKKHNFYHLIWRSLKAQEIEKIEKDGEIYLRITSNGQKEVMREFTLFSLSKKPWDRRWRIVLFDIEEENRGTRDLFRKKLKELGFGMLQKSVWITPHDILADFSEFLDSKNLSDRVFIFETTVLTGNQKELAKRVWHLDKLIEEYLTIYQDFIKDNDRYLQLNKYREKFMSVLLRDPFLPKELLPTDYQREKLWQMLKRNKLT